MTVKGSAAKKFRRGTHRIVSPASTIKRFGPQARAFGITRLANVTGLDYLGVPVFMAMRPNAKSLSVSQGKGLDADAAMASALMEAIELAHAEDFSSAQSRTANYAALRRHAADPALLPRLTTASLTSDMRLRWTLGVDLMNGNATWVPFDLVHTDFTLRYRGPFFRSSNGLASGNHLLEAQCAALCEVIERDATALFHLLGAKARAARRVRPQSVRNPDCRRLLAQLEARGIAVALWNATSDIGVPCFICRFDEAIGNDRSAIGASWGAGCHLNRDVAMVRAITEAAQSRLTMIAGSRDDLLADDYGDGDGTSLFDVALDAWERHLAGSRAADIRSLDTPTFEGDRDVLLSRLRAAGVGQAIAIDLSQERFGIPVVRVIVPDLAVHDRHGRVRAVPRERAMAKACAA